MHGKIGLIACARSARSDHQDRPSSSMIPSWVIVDQEICRKELASSHDNTDDPTTAEARASNGELVRVSFVLCEPPGASRLCLHCPEGRELSCFDAILAAHGSAVLFRLEIDHFIYWAGGSGTDGPRLSLLPRCYSTEEEVEAAEPGSWRRNPRLAPAPGRRGMGMLLVGDGGEGDFVVAELHLELAGEASAAGEWEVKHAKARGGKAKFRDLLCWWRADAVVPYRSYLCWVDYSRGVIFCDVNDDHGSPDLRYLPLPVDHIPFVGYPDPCLIGWPQASRAVCVTKSGTMMKFVGIARSDGMLSGVSEPGSDFTVTVSTLMMHRGYDDDATIGAAQLWGMEGYGDQLPRVEPQFPLVSMDDPNIIYFVLREGHAIGAGAKVWVVALDMGGREVLWYKDVKATPSDEDAETAPYNIFCNLPFFPAEFSKYMRKASPK